MGSMDDCWCHFLGRNNTICRSVVCLPNKFTKAADIPVVGCSVLFLWTGEAMITAIVTGVVIGIWCGLVILGVTHIIEGPK